LPAARQRGAAEESPIVPFVDCHVHLNDEAMQLG
jgi:hypothetical protein